MERYRNLGHDSGVFAYELGVSSITVQFTDGTVYLYTDGSAGPSNIREMHRLAQIGQGLNSFINRVVRELYAKKLR